MNGKLAVKASAALAMLLVAAAWLMPASAVGQLTTGILRGTVVGQAGAPVAGADVVAVDVERRTTYTSKTGADGTFQIAVAPGTYELTVAATGLQPVTEQVRVLVGQTLPIEINLSGEARVAEQVTVTAAQPVIELKRYEVATAVTEEQIQHLPQSNRNFLNFATLAPGVRLSSDALRQELLAGGQDSGRNTNIFIDGQSFKNDILEGGTVGQDSSRGNPFPQNAVQEYRVLTQNFKAEYEKASTAVISAVTKSGGNDLKGDVFAFYQDKELVEDDPFAGKPAYERFQTGISLGGPIVKDKTHFFVSWELNDQTRANTVTVGTVSTAPPALVADLRTREGTFDSPFTENLFFGKVSFQLGSNSLLDVSGSFRTEDEVRSFGGQTSFEASESLQQDIWSFVARHQYTTSSALFETALGYGSYQWNPQPDNPSLIGQNYFGLLRIGGRETEQDFQQKRISIREDATFYDLVGNNQHTFKGGLVLNFADYDVRKLQDANPVFNFRSDENFAFPFEAFLGSGNPDLSASNTQFGIYVQDDWTPTSQLTISLGIRWDYETDELNNDYVTPQNVRDAADDFVDGSRYFTDGNQRDPNTDYFQPRLGISYDISGKGSTVAFGGWGRYYSRVLYNHTLDERFRLQWARRQFRFSADGAPRDGQATVAWNPSYLSVAGLQGLIGTSTTGEPEAFLIDNNTESPYSDQWTLGIRQRIGPVAASLTYANIQGYNGFTWIFGTRFPNGNCCQDPPGFANILITDATKRNWYEAIYLQLDKPYSGSSKWGASLAYTYAEAEQNGGDLFSLDYVNVAAYPRYPTSTDERHRIVLSGIVGLPWELMLSTLLTLGTGLPFNIDDQSLGGGPNERQFQRNAGEPEGTFPFTSWDLRLEKDFPIGQDMLIGVIAEVFNVTNHINYGCYDGFIPPLPATNPRFGQANCVIDQPQRFQFGARFAF